MLTHLLDDDTSDRFDPRPLDDRDDPSDAPDAGSALDAADTQATTALAALRRLAATLDDVQTAKQLRRVLWPLAQEFDTLLTQVDEKYDALLHAIPDPPF